MNFAFPSAPALGLRQGEWIKSKQVQISSSLLTPALLRWGSQRPYWILTFGLKKPDEA